MSALRGQVPFRTADHAACLRDGRAAVRRENVAMAVASLDTTIARAPVEVTRRLRRATKTGAWLMVQPLTVNRTELGAQEWRDAAFLRYGLEPPELPKHATAATPNFPFFMPSTARGVASSRRVIMSSVTGSRIWRAGLSPPLTYATTPSFTRVAP